jgi:hypothetical protein
MSKDKIAQILIPTFVLIAIMLWIIEGMLDGFIQDDIKPLVKFAHNHTNSEVCYRVTGYPKWDGLYCIRFKKESTPTKAVECSKEI